MERKVCWLCGKELPEHLDKHHIFGGSNRNKSELYGAVVFLHHFTCHQFGAEAAHNNAETAEKLHEWGQRKVMLQQGWDVDEWRGVFGRNYLNDAALEEIAQEVLTHETSTLAHKGVGEAVL